MACLVPLLGLPSLCTCGRKWFSRKRPFFPPSWTDWKLFDHDEEDAAAIQIHGIWGAAWNDDLVWNYSINLFWPLNMPLGQWILLRGWWNPKPPLLWSLFILSAYHRSSFKASFGRRRPAHLMLAFSQLGGLSFLEERATTNLEGLHFPAYVASTILTSIYYPTICFELTHDFAPQQEDVKNEFNWHC